jgi:hypothetical protein
MRLKGWRLMFRRQPVNILLQPLSQLTCRQTQGVVASLGHREECGGLQTWPASQPCVEHYAHLLAWPTQSTSPSVSLPCRVRMMYV